MRFTPRRLIVSTIVLGMTLSASPSWAVAGDAGEPLSGAPPIRVGYGSFAETVTTVDNGFDGTPSCGDARGAAVFAIPAVHASVFELSATVTEGTVCAVEVYDRARGGVELSSLYDVGDRANYLRATQACPLGECGAIEANLPAGGGYLVFWPSGTAADTATLDFSGKLRIRPLFYSRVLGAVAAPCFRVRTGGRQFVSFVLPEEADGDVTWTRVFEPLGTSVSAVIASGTRRVVDTSRWKAGRHTITMTHPGTETVAPGSAERCVNVARLVPVRLSWQNERYEYDDYAVWRDGDVAIIRATYPKGPSKGTVTWRFDREVGVERYEPWQTFTVRVVGGVAELRLRATYRSNGLPFYRIRSELAAGLYNLRTLGKWKCIQFDRRR